MEEVKKEIVEKLEEANVKLANSENLSVEDIEVLFFASLLEEEAV